MDDASHAPHSQVHKRSWLVAALLASGLAGGGALPAAAHQGHDHGAPRHRASTPAPAPALPPDLAEVRDALRKYEDPGAAVRDG